MRVVAKTFVHVWRTQKAIYRLLVDDYGGLVAMLAELIVDTVTS